MGHIEHIEQHSLLSPNVLTSSIPKYKKLLSKTIPNFSPQLKWAELLSVPLPTFPCPLFSLWVPLINNVLLMEAITRKGCYMNE
jgi:hypothetical protein